MVYFSYLGEFNRTSQRSPIPGRSDQVKNHAGGYVFQVDDWMRLRRFLAIGAAGGTYYAGEREIALENLSVVKELLDRDHRKVVDLAVEYSETGRAVKNEPAIAALALAFSHDKKEVRKYAAENFSKIVRIPTHLFTFLTYVKQLRGWGRLLRETVARWYLEKDQDQLVYHILKYQRRAGWRHLDVLRLTHIKPPTEFHDRLFGWLAGKKEPPEHPLVDAFIALRRANTVKEVIKIIEENNVTWEFVPSEWLGSPEVWEALLPKLPFTALVRNLARMSASGVLSPFSGNTDYVVARLTDEAAVRKSRIHPIQAAVAAKTYASGRGFRGKLEWPVNLKVLEALENLVTLSFGNVEATGKRFFIALDVSGSMTWYSVCDALTCMEAAAVMALATVKAEENVFTAAFSHYIQPFPITKSDTFTSVVNAMAKLQFSATDCALPMIYATEKNIPVDVFVILTDNETWFGNIHPCQALEEYRRATGINAKLAVVGMVATRFSIADPKDPYQLDFVGFDTATPQAIAEFAKL